MVCSDWRYWDEDFVALNPYLSVVPAEGSIINLLMRASKKTGEGFMDYEIAAQVCVCVRACVRACVHACVRGWVGGWVGVHYGMCQRVCVTRRGVQDPPEVLAGQDGVDSLAHSLAQPDLQLPLAACENAGSHYDRRGL
jgi:hypothetical protein